jgi:hypothetical protein
MDGQVCITNTGTHYTRGLAGTIDLTAPPDTTPITTTALDVSTEQVIPRRVDENGCLVCPWHQSAYDVGTGRIAAPDSSTSAPATTKPRSTRTAKPAATSANSKPSDTPSPSPRPHNPHPHSPAGHQADSAGAAARPAEASDFPVQDLVGHRTDTFRHPLPLCAEPSTSSSAWRRPGHWRISHAKRSPRASGVQIVPVTSRFVHASFFEPAGPGSFAATRATAGTRSAAARHGGPPVMTIRSSRAVAAWFRSWCAGVLACAGPRVPIRRLAGRADLAGIGAGSVDMPRGSLGRHVD